MDYAAHPVAVPPELLSGAVVRSDLVLRTWEAIVSEREMQGVMAAVSAVLTPVVPFDCVGVSIFGQDLDVPYASYFVGCVDGESVEDMLHRRDIEIAPIPSDVVPLQYPPPRTGEPSRQPMVCGDIFASKAWLPHEFKMASIGLRSYCTFLLITRKQAIGVAYYCRFSPVAFSVNELRILGDVSRAFGVAASNALANEEVRKLREQLEAENVSLRQELGAAEWYSEIAGHSGQLKEVLETVEQVADTDSTVLITGETGTGKELIARAIHRRSRRCGGPLVKVNCAAIPPSLLASELFGHEHGAFTGAVERRKGRFEQAEGGTLFLDEIGELSPEMQVLLLRVLQEREVERLGSSESVKVDVRVVAATNRDLRTEVRAGRFRQDLLYRLNVIPIHMPPLRERREDIPDLVRHFAAKHGRAMKIPIERIEKRTLQLLEDYVWPGNVRELENVIERSVLVARGGTLRVDPATLPGMESMQLEDQLGQQERIAIETALRACRGRVSGPSGAAVRLGLPASTLEFRMKRLGIDKRLFREPVRAR